LGGDVYEIIGCMLEMEYIDLFVFMCMMGDVVCFMCECLVFVIVVVYGVVVGVGLVLVLVSDLCVVECMVRFVFFFMCVGFVGVDMGVVYLFFWLVGLGCVIELLLLGDMLLVE